MPILDNATFQGNRVLNLTLSSATSGASLGSPATAALTVADGETPPPAVQYGIYASDADGRPFTLNAGNGQVTVIGSMGVVMYDLAFDSAGTLFGVDRNSSLFRIDPRTAAVTKIGPREERA